MPEDHIRRIYFKIGWYLTGKKRTDRFWAVTLIIFIALCVLSLFHKWVVRLETLDLVFSSLVQGLLTLAALLGATAIYSLEQRKRNSSDTDVFTPNSLHEFMVYTFTLALISLVLLMFAPHISTFYLGWPSLYGVFVLTSRAFFIVIKNVWDHISG